jgi:ribonuclease E
LIVIDFIDMKESKHRNEVQRILKNHLKRDKARTTLGRISKFGILELSRQRIRPPIQFGTYYTCPTCQGKGQVRSVETLALSYLRKIWLGISKGTVSSVKGILPVEVAHYLLNRKREDLLRLESRHEVTIHLEGHPHILPEEGRLEFKKKESPETVDSQPEFRENDLEKTEAIPTQVAPNYWQSAENYLLSEAQKVPPPRQSKP